MTKKGGNWKSGIYVVQNREKYIGRCNPKYRSSWESRMFTFMDLNKNIIRWGAEIVEIPYVFQLDGRVHKYITDIYCEVKNKQGVIDKYILEIKPQKQTKEPVPPKIKNMKALKRYNYERYTYVKNHDKWKAAKIFCDRKNIKFEIITEKKVFSKEMQW